MIDKLGVLVGPAFFHTDIAHLQAVVVLAIEHFPNHRLHLLVDALGMSTQMVYQA